MPRYHGCPDSYGLFSGFNHYHDHHDFIHHNPHSNLHYSTCTDYGSATPTGRYYHTVRHYDHFSQAHWRPGLWWYYDIDCYHRSASIWLDAHLCRR